MVEAAAARVRAAALHGDPLAVEAAGRAYVAAACFALLADFAPAMVAILGRSWRSIRASAQAPRA